MGDIDEVSLTGRLICATPEQAATVARLLPGHTRRTRAEPGCLRFDVEPSENPLVWIVNERYASWDDFDAHQDRTRRSLWGRSTRGIERDYRIGPG